jgi:hypothetical protein
MFRVSSLVCRERKNAVGFLPELNGIFHWNNSFQGLVEFGFCV